MAGSGLPTVLVSLPREEAVVRLLELPECSDDELPELVRLQAATRSAVPFDRLLLDFLPLPRVADVVGPHVLMVILGKPTADRVQALLTAAGLQAAAIQLSAVGTGEVVARQAARRRGGLGAGRRSHREPFRVARRDHAIPRHHILFMHGATVSTHLPPDAIVAQILAETSRRDGGSLASGARRAHRGGLDRRFVRRNCPDCRKPSASATASISVLESPFATPGVRADFDAKGRWHGAVFPPWALLLAPTRGGPRSTFCIRGKKVVKPDHRRLRQALAGAGRSLRWSPFSAASICGSRDSTSKLPLATRQRYAATISKADPLMKRPNLSTIGLNATSTGSISFVKWKRPSAAPTDSTSSASTARSPISTRWPRSPPPIAPSPGTTSSP